MECKTRSEFFARYNAAYMYSRRHGFLDEICSHMVSKRLAYGYWLDKDVVLEHLSQCDSIHEFYKRYKRGYYASKENSWFDEVTAPLKDQRFLENSWTLEKIKVEAAKYKTKTDFAKYCGVAFAMAHRIGALDEVCHHMLPEFSDNARICYAFEFADWHVYVGVTANVACRKHYHLNQPSSKVYNHMKDSGIVPEFKIICESLSICDTCLLERDNLMRYKDSGWTLLNLIDPDVEKYQYEDVIDLAMACQDYDIFRKNYSNAYWAALRHKCMDEITRILPSMHNPKFTQDHILDLAEECKSYSDFCAKFEKESLAAQALGLTEEIKRSFCQHRVSIYYSEDLVINVARQCKTYTEFYNSHPNEYAAAVRNGWLDKIHQILPEEAPEEISKEVVIDKAKQYKKRVDFLRHCPKEYNIALSKGWIDELFEKPKMPLAPIKTISKEKVIAIAKSCSSYAEFQKFHSCEYQVAYKYHWLDDIKEVLPTSIRKPYTLDEILEIASNCDTYSGFKQLNASAYAAARKNNWLDEVRKVLPAVNHKPFTKDEILLLAKESGSYSKFAKVNRSAYKAAIKLGITDEIKKIIANSV